MLWAGKIPAWPPSPISSLKLIERRLLFASLIGLLFAVIAGYLLASLHAKRILRL